MINKAIQGVIASGRPYQLSYSSVVLADAPDGYWPLDELSGTVVNDSSGNGKNGLRNSGSINQSPIVTDGGRSYNLAGSPAYLDFGPNWGSFTSFTFEGWFNFNSVADQMHIATKWGSTTADDLTFFLWLTSTFKVQFIVNMFGGGGGAKTITGSTTIVPGTNYHICVTYQTAVKITSIYINGALDAQSTTLGGTDPDVGSIAESLSVGAKIYNGNPTDMSPTTRYGNFKCDNLAFYKKTLTPARVLAHYQAGI